MGIHEQLSQIIEEKRQQFIEISNCIWSYAETGFQEHRSAELLCEFLEKEGFTVERGAGGIETAFIASWGSGTPVAAILGEFDALSGLSQKGGLDRPEELEKSGSGHGCGHNLLGTGALAAAVAVRHYMEQNQLPGTIRYYGCPGEEIGGGKTFMVRAGLFDDVDFALTWHPGSHNRVRSERSLACYEVNIRFTGKSAHAAASPHLGRSALDAVELMNIGANYLREHIIPEARVHYAITNTGGLAPNVVQAEAEVLYFIRAPKVSVTHEIYERICDIARGAALMTGTQVQIDLDAALFDLIPNRTLETVLQRNFDVFGAPSFDEQELEFARRIQSTLSQAEIDFDLRGREALRGKVLSDVVEPLSEQETFLFASTDVGDVRWVVPTAQISAATFAIGTPLHTWQVVSQGATSVGHKGMLHAGKVLAASALEVMRDPMLIDQAKAELKARLNGERYVSPLPENLKSYKVRVYPDYLRGEKR
jgi:aminobenzoyl-glutamate utilization protein B